MSEKNVMLQNLKFELLLVSITTIKDRRLCICIYFYLTIKIAE